MSFRRNPVRSWLALAALVGCATSPSAPSASVRFVLDAPLCSSVLAMRFSIDGAVAGTDTFRVNLSSPRTASRRFSVTPGVHLVGARVDGGFVWPDTAVTLAIGSAVDDTLPFYCS